MDIRILNIGTMACNELWGEREPVRSGHATTTLIRVEDTTILVDPSLPPQVIAARLGERAAITPDAVTHVFLTSFRPDVRRGIMLFENAEWLISAAEREAVGTPLAADLKRLAESGLLDDPDDDDRALVEAIQHDLAVLQRCKPAPDALAPGVDLFPLHGVTPGMTGLLLPSNRGDLLITGDAVPTREHLEQGRIPIRSDNPDAARDSLLEAIEIADTVILGRDNFMVNPIRRSFTGAMPG